LGASLLAILTIGIVILGTRWPFSREAIVRAIQEATARPVEIGAFKMSYFPPGCLAESVRVLHNGDPRATPLVSIEKLHIHGSLTGMFTSPKRLAQVKAAGMRIVIPAKGSPQGTARLPPLDTGKGEIEVAKIVLDDATLEFLPAESDDEPYRLHIDALALHGVGSGKPWKYDAILRNTRPPGVIRAAGEFGPWNPDNPGATPASGEYTYRDVDLGVFRGISGTLQAKGEFRGPLNRIETDGAIEIPDFHVEKSGNRAPMKVSYRAAVDGTKGHVRLDPVEARFWRTTLVARGSIADTVTLDLSVPRGRIEDILRIFVEEKTAPLSGPVALDADVLWPPGPRDFVEKIRLNVVFGIENSRFRSQKTQNAIDRISRGEEAGATLSDLRGRVAFRDGVARFRGVTFDVPGASAKIEGTYGLVDHRVNLHGVLHTTGSLSDAATGFKAFLLKALSPFIGKKKDDVKIVPFKITGTFKDAKVGLD
jgi:hypothetical protein